MLLFKKRAYKGELEKNVAGEVVMVKPHEAPVGGLSDHWVLSSLAHKWNREISEDS